MSNAWREGAMAGAIAALDEIAEEAGAEGRQNMQLIKEKAARIIATLTPPAPAPAEDFKDPCADAIAKDFFAEGCSDKEIQVSRRWLMGKLGQLSLTRAALVMVKDFHGTGKQPATTQEGGMSDYAWDKKPEEMTRQQLVNHLKLQTEGHRRYMHYVGVLAEAIKDKLGDWQRIEPLHCPSDLVDLREALKEVEDDNWQPEAPTPQPQRVEQVGRFSPEQLSELDSVTPVAKNHILALCEEIDRLKAQCAYWKKIGQTVLDAAMASVTTPPAQDYMKAVIKAANKRFGGFGHRHNCPKACGDKGAMLPNRCTCGEDELREALARPDALKGKEAKG